MNGAYSFYSSNLEEVTLSNKLKTIGHTSFGGNKLEDVIIPESVTNISIQAFANNKLTSIVIPKDVSIIGNWAFSRNDLREIIILNDYVNIGDEVFTGNQTNSKDVTIKGYDPSTAKEYAQSNNHTFEELVDKRELESLIEEAERLDEDDYTPDSFRNLVTALDVARAVLADDNATQDEVSDAMEQLQQALNGLQPIQVPDPVVDKEGLRFLIEEAELLDETDYTPDSFSALVAALDVARAVLADDNATQEEIDDAIEQLEDAMDNLVKSADTETPADPKITKDDLEDIINEAKALDKERFTDDSFARVEKSLDQAKEIFHKDDATDEEILKAYTELRHAIDLLKKVGGPVKPKEDKKDTPEKPANGKGGPGKLLPSTATGWYNLFAIGIGLLVTGLIGIIMIRRKRSA